VNRIALLDKMIATVGTSSKADLVERFERLLANAREQMLSEDDLMMSLNYPEYDEHYNDHYTLYTTILGLRLKAALGFCSVKDLKRVRELCVGHISRHDHRLETYLGAGQHSC
jgi:hemerythrin